MFITFEGIEGVGKSTLVQAVAHHLSAVNIPYCLTREPGGTPLAEALRALLLAHHDELIVPATETLLMFASRAQHVANVIKPNLSAGKWVLSDRFTDASFAYQGAGRGIDMTVIDHLAEFSQAGCVPDLTFLLVAPVELALQRAKKRAELDRFESEQLAFFERVQVQYLQRAEHEPTRFCVIDATLGIDQVQAIALTKIASLLKD